MRLQLSSILLSLLILAISCNKDDTTGTTIKPKGTRKLGIHITTTETNNYEKDFQLAKSVGMESVPLTLIWNTIEIGTNWDFTYPNIANVYFPLNNVELVLTISPIYAINKAIPSDIEGLSFDDPIVISRFNRFLDSLHKHMPQVKLTAMLLGNEVDLYLGDNPQNWEKYKVFYQSARTHARQLWGPSLKVGVECTFGKMQSTTAQQIKTITATSDVAGVSYYPLNADFTMQSPSAPQADISAMVNFYTDIPIIIEETGYATSADCNSNEEKQKEYIQSIFKAWDKYDEKILFIGFLWLTDLSEQQAQDFVKDYGATNFPNVTSFKEYLRTTALRTYPGNGTDKKGFLQLKTETEARGWK